MHDVLTITAQAFQKRPFAFLVAGIASTTLPALPLLLLGQLEAIATWFEAWFGLIGGPLILTYVIWLCLIFATSGVYCMNLALGALTGVQFAGKPQLRRAVGVAIVAELILFLAGLPASLEVPYFLVLLSFILVLALFLVSVRFTVFMPALIAERGLLGVDGLTRSWRLTKGRYWWTFGVSLVLELPLALALISGWGGFLVGFLVTVVGFPMICIGVVAIYLTLRAREAAIDVNALITQLSQTSR